MKAFGTFTLFIITLFLMGCNINNQIQGIGSNAPNKEKSHFPKDFNDWQSYIRTEALTQEAFDELIERIDQAPKEALWEIVFKDQIINESNLITLSNTLNKLINGIVISENISPDEANKLQISLMFNAIDKGVSLSGFDLSQVDFKDVDLKGIDLSESNITGNQLNEVVSLEKANLCDMNLQGFNPATDLNINNLSLCRATNIPWTAINANTTLTTIYDADLSGIDFTNFNNPSVVVYSNVDFSNSTNLNWTSINGAFFQRELNFENVDLTGFNPAIGEDLSGIKLKGATNIP